MGVLDAAGYGDTPFAQWWDTRRNAIGQFGAGLARGRNLGEGVAYGAEGALQGRQMDDAYATQQKEEAERQKALALAGEQARAASQFLTGNPELQELVANQSIDFGTGYKIWQDIQAGNQPKLEVINGQIVDMNTQQVLGDFRTPEAPKTPTAPSGFAFNQDGSALAPIPGGPASEEYRDKDPTLNANQSAAALYADRMIEADKILADPALSQAMLDPTNAPKAGVPFIGNALVSPEYQQAEQAQRDFVNAVLRRESGAVISPSEFENAKKQYFPQPFDSQQVIDQKARNRKTAIDGIARSAGAAYQMPGGEAGYVAPTVEQLLEKYR